MDTEILKQYIERIQNAPEQQRIREIDSLRWSFKIVRGNYDEYLW